MLIEVREDWLATVAEAPLEPQRAVVDPHHHFFVASPVFPFYDLDALHADTATHRVEQTVYVQCGEGYCTDGPEELRCVGETAWVDAIARDAAARPGMARIGGIVGTAELRHGAAVRAVLEAHCAASPLFRGIRQIAAFDDDASLPRGEQLDGPALYADADFRAGFAVLADMGLSFDAWHYHHQTPALAELARSFPHATIVLDHFGTPLGVGAWAGREDAVYAEWARDLAAIARCENVVCKLGGLVMPWNGFGFEQAARPPTSDELVARQRRYYEHAIDCFGAARCMFESNFPVDKCAVSYTVLWNAFKKIAASATPAEQAALLGATARRVYRLAADG
ncbi:MAG: amidohydrolase family protein [Gammaproteobacteria bacterium]